MFNNALFYWIYFQAIIWHKKRLSTLHNGISIDSLFFNVHNQLTPFSLMTLPYFVCSATKDCKGFSMFGKWNLVSIDKMRIAVPEGFDSFIYSQYNKKEKIGLKNIHDLELPTILDAVILEEGLSFVRSSAPALLETSPVGLVGLMYRCSAISVIVMLSDKNKFSDDFLTSMLCKKDARHVYARNIDNRIFS